MDVGGRRKSAGPRIGGVMAGSVWESRMKLDEFKGGIKVFNGEQDCSSSSSSNNNNNNDDNNDNNSVGNDEESAPTTTTTASNDLSGAIVPVVQMDKKANLRAKQSPPAPTGGKRKTWKSENLEGSPFHIARQRSEMGKNLDEQCKEELGVSSDGTTKRSPLLKKTRSESIKDLSVSVDGIERKTLPTRTMKSKSSSSQKVSGEITTTGSDAIEKSSVQLLRKVKSESVNKVFDDSCNGNAKNNSLQLVKAKSESSKAFEESSNAIRHNSVVKPQKLGDDDESKKNLKESNEGIEKNCKVFDICEEEEKVFTSNAVLLEVKKSPTKTEATEHHQDELDLDDEFEEASDEKIEVEIEKKSLVAKEICTAEQKPKQIVVEDKKLLHSNETPSIGLKKKQSSPPQPPLIRVHPSPTKTNSIPVSNGYQRIPRTHSKLQSFVDLIMWKDVSKSAFVFGIGTFFIISSSYTKDLNISLISVFSYLGLAYLAAIFFFRSFISRGSIDLDDSSMDYVVGEEEAIWLIKLFLPYVNEFLLKLKALFSGDPATTMKMAVLLFVLARCGSSITIWKMAKLSFFGVFTVPKICSSYSPQLTAYGTGTFWIRRFGDAWESCSHKKAVAFAIFTLVWNLSSIIARIWAVFMLFAAFRYYKNSLIREGWVEEEEEVAVTARQAQNRGPVQRPKRRPITLDSAKQKKSF